MLGCGALTAKSPAQCAAALAGGRQPGGAGRHGILTYLLTASATIGADVSPSGADHGADVPAEGQEADRPLGRLPFLTSLAWYYIA